MTESSPQASAGLLAGFGPGRRVAGYLLEDQIGVGGMAVVFRAVDERLGRKVALKILVPALAADQAFRKRFIRESRAAAAVDDPHIIPVYDAGEADGVLFIAMRLVPGGDVRTLLAGEEPLPPGRVAAIISPVASALDAAHAAGLVHRDVKPGNILIDARPDRPDHVYLSDFGLSKGASSAALTGTGMFLGTPGYIAPEQIQGQEVDGRVDQYALACAAFELLAGRPPFDRDQGLTVLWAHLSEPPPSPRAQRPELPAGVDEVFARALAKRPEDRYPTCRDFAEALRTALGLLPYNAAPGLVPGPRHPPEVVATEDQAAAMADTGRPGSGRPDPGGQSLVPAQDGIGRHELPTVTAGDPGALWTRPMRRRAGHYVAGPGPYAAGLALDDVVAVAFSPDGSALAIGESGGNAYLCDAGTARSAGKLTASAADLDPASHPVEAIAFSPDSSLLAVACADGSTRIWAPAQRRLVATLVNPDSAGVNAVAFSPDGAVLAAGDENGRICLWQVKTGQLARVVAGPQSRGVCSVAFSPDRSMFATGDGNGHAYLWTAGGDGLATLAGRVPGEVFAVGFTPDGSVLATSDGGGGVSLWDPVAATRISTLVRPGARAAGVLALAYSPRPPLLAVGYSVGGACLWDGERGRVLTTVGKRSPGAVLAVAFSPGGELLATGHSDGSAALWDGASGRPIATV